MNEDTQVGQVQEGLFGAASETDQQFAEYYEEPENAQENSEDGQPNESEEFLEAEGEQIPAKEIDNIKSYKHFQSKFTHAQKETAQEREARIRFEEENRILKEQLQNLQNPNAQTIRAPERPNPLPPMPEGFTMADAFDDSTPSGQWYRQKIQYDNKMDTYNRYWMDEREKREQSENQQRQRQAEFAQYKNTKIGEFQRAGATLQEAMETFDWLSSDESGKAESILAYRRYLKGSKGKPQTQGQRPGQIQPASAVPSEHEPKPNDGQDFMNVFGTRGQSIFKTG